MQRRTDQPKILAYLPHVFGLCALVISYGACPKLDSYMPKAEAQAADNAITQRLAKAETSIDAYRMESRSDFLRLENKIDEVLRYLRDSAPRQRK